MINPQNLFSGPFGTVLLLLLVIWTVIWQGLGLWRGSRSGQRNWFIAMLIVNSAGILPIIYLLFFWKDRKKLKILARLRKLSKNK